jgi:MoaA/NifB/PqqE/SkfB family radical SAM enzyme
MRQTLLAAARALDEGNLDEARNLLRSLAPVRGDRPERLVASALWKRLLSNSKSDDPPTGGGGSIATDDASRNLATGSRSGINPIDERKRDGRPVLLLELHVTHACNLTCESCSHYSNHGHRGSLELAQAKIWMSAWSERIAVKEFNLLGGEPTMHPHLSEFVVLVRKHWPAAHIRIITNGFFLHRHPDLPSTLAADGNASLALSIHHNEPAYVERLRPIFDLLAIWQRDHGTVVETRQAHYGWTRRYLGFGAAMLPFEDGRPRQGWEICPAKYCMQLHDGKLWKCPPLAYLGLQKAKYNLSPKWDPYLRYRPLDKTCTDRELDDFLALEDEPACSMCSAEIRHFPLPSPLQSRSSKSASVTLR